MLTRTRRIGGGHPPKALLELLSSTRRSTEGGEVPGRQGATTENIGQMRGRSNAARRDASPAECRRVY